MRRSVRGFVAGLVAAVALVAGCASPPADESGPGSGPVLVLLVENRAPEAIPTRVLVHSTADELRANETFLARARSVSRWEHAVGAEVLRVRAEWEGARADRPFVASIEATVDAAACRDRDEIQVSMIVETVDPLLVRMGAADCEAEPSPPPSPEDRGASGGVEAEGDTDRAVLLTVAVVNERNAAEDVDVRVSSPSGRVLLNVRLSLAAGEEESRSVRIEPSGAHAVRLQRADTVAGATVANYWRVEQSLDPSRCPDVRDIRFRYRIVAAGGPDAPDTNCPQNEAQASPVTNSTRPEPVGGPTGRDFAADPLDLRVGIHNAGTQPMTVVYDFDAPGGRGSESGVFTVGGGATTTKAFFLRAAGEHRFELRGGAWTGTLLVDPSECDWADRVVGRYEFTATSVKVGDTECVAETP
ncbi:MAG: hypothetical protein ACT4PT_08000 [Methanobacteriota archaeon]